MNIKKGKLYSLTELHPYGRLIPKGNGVNYYYYTQGKVLDMICIGGSYQLQIPSRAY